jgi:hypothetical protein
LPELVDTGAVLWDNGATTLTRLSFQMKKSPLHAAALALCLACILHPSSVPAQGTAFTYQGRLNDGANPASGNYDFSFALFSGNGTDSGQIGATQTNLAVAVTNGLFTANMDFGPVFNGNAAWLAVGVRSNGQSGFTALSPMQAITPSPYALYAPTAGTAASASALAANGVVPLAALPSAVVTNGAGGVALSGLFGGAFSGNGSGLTNTAGAVTSGNYVFAHDDALSNGTFPSGRTNAIFYSAANLSGWTCANNTTFTCGQTGLYLVSYYALFINNGGLGMFAATPRTGPIPGSASYSGVSGRGPLSQSFLASLNAGDTLQIEAVPGTDPVMFVGPVNIPGPDATLTIVRIQ